jgi:hypothetical protein
MFIHTLEYLESIRQLLFTECAQLVANLKEVDRLVPIIRVLITDANSEMGEIPILRKRSREATSFDSLFQIYRNAEKKFCEAETRISQLKRLCICTAIERDAADLKQKLEALLKEIGRIWEQAERASVHGNFFIIILSIFVISIILSIFI